MRIEKLEYNNDDYEEELLSRLRGTVFHVTRQEAFEQMLRDGKIRNNKEGGLGINTSSDKSFFRNRGCVCLFDLRNTTEEIIQKTLDCYYFLGPSWFAVCNHDCSEKELRLAYLILNQESYSRIIPNEFVWQTMKEEGWQYAQCVPKTECGYKGDIPLMCIDTVLLVRVRKSISGYTRMLMRIHAEAIPGIHDKSLTDDDLRMDN